MTERLEALGTGVGGLQAAEWVTSGPLAAVLFGSACSPTTRHAEQALEVGPSVPREGVQGPSQFVCCLAEGPPLRFVEPILARPSVDVGVDQCRFDGATELAFLNACRKRRSAVLREFSLLKVVHTERVSTRLSASMWLSASRG